MRRRGLRRSAVAGALCLGAIVASFPPGGFAVIQAQRAADRPRTAEPAIRSGPPSWVADAVFYQVFPDRFRNGDPRNDPRPNDLRGAPPTEPVRGWQVSPWTADWYRLQPWEKATGKDFYGNVQARRYGGDLQGLLERLDYLQGLGVDGIYLNPIFEAPSLHRYDTTFFHHVDNNLGPDPEGDRVIWATESPGDPSTWKWTSADRLFLKLVQECHRRKMRVILDGVFDHVGITFWAFRDVRARGGASRYAGWFAIKAFDDPKTPADEFDYLGWGGSRDLPELRKEGDTLAAPVREHLRAVVRRWGDPNGDGDPSDGIDGWRLDLADRVPHGFWKEFRRWVLGINREAYLVGEVFWEDWDFNRMWEPAPWLRGDELDGVMNYRFAAAVRAFCLDRQNAIAPSELDARLAAIRPSRAETALALLNVLDSHDTDRLASQAVNPDRAYDHMVGPASDPKYDVRAPRPDEWKRARLAAALQFAWVGAPMVYYGDEAGMWGGDDPDCRKPMVWKELRYEDEAAHPLGQKRRADPVKLDEEQLAFYQALGQARVQQSALRHGTAETVLADDARRLYAFVRATEDDRVVAAFNGSDREQTVDLPVGTASRDLLSPRRYRPKDGKTSVTLPALSAVLLAPDRRP
jgi:cyclomaltodextrinase / maltogenic alpha-amylase / neopullulanase